MTSTEAAAHSQRILDKTIQKKHTYSVLLAVQSKDGQFDYAEAAGFADTAQQQPISSDTPYFIASITKLYTATIIIRLIEQGLLDFDDLISKYLPAELLDGIHVYKGVDYTPQLTVRHLLHQTSGLADYFEDKPKGGESLMDKLKEGYDAVHHVTDVVEMVRGLTPHFEPDAKNGTKSHYSDTNYQLLGAIIERITGKSIAENFCKQIFEPLGLTQTYVYDYEHPRDGQQPIPFYNKETRLDIPKTMTAFGPDGGIVSTLAESMIFLRAYTEGKLFSASHFTRMHAQWNSVFFPIVSYGYGVMRAKMPRLFTLFQYSPELIGHSGASGSFAYYAPKEELYIVGTINQIDSPSRPFQLMLNAVSGVAKSLR